jgi:sec-independent protein translocase protein TatA
LSTDIGHWPGKEKTMGGLSIWHWVIVLVVVVIIFGTGKLKNAGSDLGKAVKGFKDGVKDDEVKHPGTTTTPPVPPQQMADKSTIDVETREKSRF